MSTKNAACNNGASGSGNSSSLNQNPQSNALREYEKPDSKTLKTWKHHLQDEVEPNSFTRFSRHLNQM